MKKTRQQRESRASVSLQSVPNVLASWHCRAGMGPGISSRIGVAASDQMYELLRHRFAVVVAVGPALLSHSATNARAIGVLSDALAAIGCAVAHDLRSGNCPQRATRGKVAKADGLRLAGQWTASLAQRPAAAIEKIAAIEKLRLMASFGCGLFHFRPGPRDALSCPEHAVFRHLCPR